MRRPLALQAPRKAAPPLGALAGLSGEEWLALKAWLMGTPAHRALDYVPTDDKPDEYEPHHYIHTLKTRALAIARAHARPDLTSTLRDPQPVSEKSIKRIRQALDDLAALPLTITPKPDDPVTKWLPTRAANALVAHGIKTIVELHQAAIRPNWYRSVPGLGRAGRSAAETLIASMHQAKSLTPIKKPGHWLVQAWRALEVDRAPPELDGRQGRFRADKSSCALEADSDYLAIDSWLQTQSNALTKTAYRKEMIRVLLWTTTVRGKAFSDLTVEDATKYRDFLADPQPAEAWIGPRRSIEAPDWRPFSGPLNERSRAYALQVVRACARWLRETNYLNANPWASVRTTADLAQPLSLERVPSRYHWKMVRELADQLERLEWPEDAAKRCRFVLDFLRGTGLRVSEFAQLRLGDIYQGEPGEWFVRVRGKGNKVGIIDLLPMPKTALEQYLISRGLSPLIDHNDPGIPVVSALDNPSVPLGRKAVWAIIDRFRKLAVDEFAEVNKHLVAQLAKMSPHTMRHIFGSHALENGAQLKDVQEGLRHANIKTTSGYVHSDKRQRRKRLAGAIQ